MSSISLWSGLNEPGKACVMWGGKETTLGAHTPTRGASPKCTKTNWGEKAKDATLTEN